MKSSWENGSAVCAKEGLQSLLSDFLWSDLVPRIVGEPDTFIITAEQLVSLFPVTSSNSGPVSGNYRREEDTGYL